MRPRVGTRKKRRVMKGGNSLVSVFLMCFNEDKIIEFTVKYYQRQFPGCKITICDNISSDDSVKIAKRLGCEIHSYDTDGAFDEVKLMELRNSVWKTAATPWVIVCDMDELLTANRDDIAKEEASGTTILKTKGYEIYGKSAKNDLSNIKNSLDKITDGEYSYGYSKSICFNKNKITDINFGAGSHNADPKGEVKYSEKEYFLYHYKKLGLNYLRYAHSRSHSRAKRSKEKGVFVATHYTNNNSKIQQEFDRTNKPIEVIPALETFYLK